MKHHAISLTKFDENALCEDASFSAPRIVAVSDGAGGGGVLAERWSEHIVRHIPEAPILDFAQFLAWYDGMWEDFYNWAEEVADSRGGLFQRKFYDEGSFATVVAAWRVSDTEARWMKYGDSVAFCYTPSSKKLAYSPIKLAEFDRPPYLINCSSQPVEEGFMSGMFETATDSIMFVTSDALARYIITMYAIEHKKSYGCELQEAIGLGTQNAQYIYNSTTKKLKGFERNVISKLLNSSCVKGDFEGHLARLRRMGILGHDDYSIAWMRNK